MSKRRKQRPGLSPHDRLTNLTEALSEASFDDEVKLSAAEAQKMCAMRDELAARLRSVHHERWWDIEGWLTRPESKADAEPAQPKPKRKKGA